MNQKKWIKMISVFLFCYVLAGMKQNCGLEVVWAGNIEQTAAAKDETSSSEGKGFHRRIDFKESYKISNLTSYYESFYLSDKMLQVNADIDLSILMSNTAIMDVSSITVYANEIPVGSYKFNELAESGTIKLHIDEQYFKEGNNTISIRAYIKSSQEDCEMNEEINWALVRKGSQIILHYDLLQIDTVSELYEGTYFFEDQGGKICVALPEQRTELDATLAATLSALIGNHFKAEDPDIAIENISYAQAAEAGHSVIVLGTRAQVAAGFPEIGLSGTDEVQIRQLKGIAHIFLLLEDEKQLMQFTEIFSDAELYGQLTEKEYAFAENDNVSAQPKFRERLHGAISEIGYQDSMVVGSGRQVFQYYIGLPGKYTRLKENKIKFLYSYSENVDFSDSYVTIYVNNEPVKTKPLTKENAENDSIEFSIPENLYDYNGYNIAVDFNLSKNNPCESKISNGSWVKVNTQQSTYDFRIKDQQTFSLFTSTHFVQDNEGCIDGKILMDGRDDSSEGLSVLQELSDFCAYLGKRAFDVRILRVADANAVPAGYEGFILGDFTSPLVQSMNNRLTIRLAESGKVIENKLFTQVNENIGLIQLSKDAKTVVIAGSNREQLSYAMEHYITKVDRYDRQIVSMDDTILLKHTDEPQNDPSIGELVEEVGPVHFLKANWKLILFAALAMLVLLVFAFQIRKKNNFRKPHKKRKPARQKAAEPAGEKAAEPAGEKAAEPAGEKAAEPVKQNHLHKPENGVRNHRDDTWDDLLFKDAAVSESVARAVCEKFKLDYDNIKVAEMSGEMLQYESSLGIRERLKDCFLVSANQQAASLGAYYKDVYNIQQADEIMQEYCSLHGIDGTGTKVGHLSIGQLMEIDEEFRKLL